MDIFGQNWVAVAFMLVAAFFMGMLLMTIAQVVAPTKKSVVKSQPYESGVPDIKPVRSQFTARFYVIAMLFVIFDLEAAFIFPWAVNVDVLGMYGFVHMTIFIALLMLSYVYAWKKGALEWV